MAKNPFERYSGPEKLGKEVSPAEQYKPSERKLKEYRRTGFWRWEKETSTYDLRNERGQLVGNETVTLSEFAKDGGARSSVRERRDQNGVVIFKSFTHWGEDRKFESYVKEDAEGRPLRMVRRGWVENSPDGFFVEVFDPRERGAKIADQAYNKNGELTRSTEYKYNRDGLLAKEESFSYKKSEETGEMVTNLAERKSYEYDARGAKVKELEEEGDTTRVHLYKDGKRVQMKIEDAYHTSEYKYERDKEGKVIKCRYDTQSKGGGLPDRGEYIYEYDKKGRVRSVTDRKENGKVASVQEYSYDKRGLQTGRVESDYEDGEKRVYKRDDPVTGAEKLVERYPLV